MTSEEVRSRFVEYFKKQGHTHVPSSRLVPEDDPTLLFTNSGMVQFKNAFLGLENRPYKRATTYQKCVRAGGKHNDLENVGFTARHHTFFEMLGNFSFGDYFKKDAIHFAWDLLTNDLKIPKDKLFVTVFTNDDEASDIWEKQEKVPKARISRFGEKDNFWQMGDTGPCGPCSEIFYDHGPEAGCGKPDCAVGCSCDRFVEIWNLVFMQFNKDAQGKVTPLPRPSIDTGSGLERLTAVMQNVVSNYQTDIFKNLISVMEKMSGKKYVNDMSDLAVAMRVMADHARASTFLIADGILPSNEGQGYVLRRIMRRGIRYGRKLSGDSIITEVSKQVLATMRSAYPELKERENLILTTIHAEEERFNQTLDQGTEILNQELSELKKKKKTVLSGETVFKLYDTFGFPVDLTMLMAKEAGVSVDESAFEKAMAAQKEMSKGSWKGGAGDTEKAALLKHAQSLKPTEFLGYEHLEAQAQVLGLFQSGEPVKSASGEVVIAFDKTPFYAESGGQVGDAGTIKGRGEISNTLKIGNIYFHWAKVKDVKVGDKLDLVVSPRRRDTMRNHSATHLLHSALRKVLGTHVTQAGSLVEPDRLRFDYTHSKPMTEDEKRKVEQLVNDEIRAGRDVGVKVQPYQMAIKEGAMALFGEKYASDVRVVAMGDFSKELCGGTHVSNTADIKVFKITSESGVSSGVRRIEAITGNIAIDFLLERHESLNVVEQTLNVTDHQVVDRVHKLIEQTKKLEKDLKKALVQGQTTSVDDLVKSAKSINGIRVVSHHVPVSDREILSSLSDRIRDKIQSGVIVLIGKGEEASHPIIVTVTKDLVGKYHAGNILKDVAGVMKGRGGGRPDFAQGAGSDATQIDAALGRVFELV